MCNTNGTTPVVAQLPVAHTHETTQHNRRTLGLNIGTIRCLSASQPASQTGDLPIRFYSLSARNGNTNE